MALDTAFFLLKLQECPLERILNNTGQHLVMFFYPLHQISPEIRIRKKICRVFNDFHGTKVEQSDVFYFKYRSGEVFRSEIKIFTGITVRFKI